MSDIANLIKGFCEDKSEYTIYEDYPGRGMFDRRCLGVVVENGYSYMDMMIALTQYLGEQGYDDVDLKLEGVSVDSLGLDTVVYFPNIEGTFR